MMKVAIFGSTGRTGRLAVTAALARGHEVTAVARDPARLAPVLETLDAEARDRLSLVRGDAMNRASLIPALEDQQAVISVIGARRPWRPDAVYSRGMDNILAVMKSHRVPRLVCVSASGVGSRPPATGSVLGRVLLQFLFKNSIADMARMETAVRASDTDWTIVRPPHLTNRPATAAYRVVAGPDVPGGRTLSRSDLAEFLVRQLEADEHSRTVVAIAD
jgi:putative NADH-flavin reductase